MGSGEVSYKENFARIETKYMIDAGSYDGLMRSLKGLIKPDVYGDTRIYNIYYDTPDYRLIRASIEKPIYREKLRLRSYCVPDKNTGCFLEIKKKYEGVVYKRRIRLPYGQAVANLEKGEPFHCMEEEALEKGLKFSVDTQIENEINSMIAHYKNLQPMMVISYDRLAFTGVKDPDFRVTFDSNITWRTGDLDLSDGGYGAELLDKGCRLMEVKCGGAVPFEFAEILSKHHIYKTTYSKYGNAYKEYVRRSRKCLQTCLAQ